MLYVLPEACYTPEADGTEPTILRMQYEALAWSHEAAVHVHGKQSPFAVNARIARFALVERIVTEEDQSMALALAGAFVQGNLNSRTLLLSSLCRWTNNNVMTLSQAQPYFADLLHAEDTSQFASTYVGEQMTKVIVRMERLQKTPQEVRGYLGNLPWILGNVALLRRITDTSYEARKQKQFKLLNP